MSTQVTFYQDIKPLYTQYDRIMMMFYCDLWDYEQVKARAKSLYLCIQPAQPGANPGGWSKLPQVHVMPIGTGPWSQDKIDLFGQWLNDGCLEGTPPPAPPVPGPLVPGFIAVSKVLTGFQSLDILGDVDTLAQTYIDRITASPTGGQLENLLNDASTAGYDKILNADDSVAGAFSQYIELLKTITLAWYTATVEKSPAQPDDNQYIQGLQWRAARAHPMGFANENVPFYWQYKPTDKYTGLIPWNQSPDE